MDCLPKPQEPCGHIPQWPHRQPIFAKDPSGKIIQINPAYEQIGMNIEYGFSSGTMPLPNPAQSFIIEPTDVPGLYTLGFNPVGAAMFLASLSMFLIDIFQGRPKMDATSSTANFATSASPVLRILGQGARVLVVQQIPLSSPDSFYSYGPYRMAALAQLMIEFPNHTLLENENLLGQILHAMGNLNQGGQIAFLQSIINYEEQNKYLLTQQILTELLSGKHLTNYSAQLEQELITFMHSGIPLVDMSHYYKGGGVPVGAAGAAGGAAGGAGGAGAAGAGGL